MGFLELQWESVPFFMTLWMTAVLYGILRCSGIKGRAVFSHRNSGVGDEKLSKSSEILGVL